MANPEHVEALKNLNHVDFNVWREKEGMRS